MTNPSRQSGRRALVVSAVFLCAAVAVGAGFIAAGLRLGWPLGTRVEAVAWRSLEETRPALLDLVARVTMLRARTGARIAHPGVPDALVHVTLLSQLPDLRVLSERAHAVHARLATRDGGAADNAVLALRAATKRSGENCDALVAALVPPARMPAPVAAQIVWEIEAAARQIAALPAPRTGVAP
ncbi:MAG: hypothetical protein Q7R30_25220 [Acidobacteriota bacterium]|nr:hypothetical protein [Acidobacteriota bacterium]